ncbi:unnamed protein product [Adineta steineri]|uniref:Reverse transcriptase domain-containing protein n=1 Tax=Adineta steineri TaxID=433720 RepID=A0A818S3V3_9BILA|nr:unnamed protein product [Adineta steineri]
MNIEIFCQSNLTKTDLRILLKLCLNNSYFIFSNKLYRQIEELAMGNVLSPLLADLYMHNSILNTLHQIKDKLFRYVDDIFIIIKMMEDEVESYVKSLNLKRTKIKFTLEYEENKEINFLHTNVTRNINEHQLDIRWFRKSTANDRFSNFHFNHHNSIKLNCIKNMTDKIINITKNKEQQHIVIIIKRETKFTLSLPCVTGIEVLERKLEQISIKLYFSYPLKLRSLTTLNVRSQSKSII